jgi:acylphosphatase
MKAAPTARVGPLGHEPRRARLAIYGAVQGVGFRPFVYRLATELGLAGWVNNSSQGVFVEVEGGRACVEEFVSRIEAEKPPRSSVQNLETSWLDAAGYTGFEIRPSSASGAKTALVLPDIATCGDCLREIFDPRDRRYRYPFTNCTNCGPRFSIIEALPYDRPNISMKSFVMCEQCRAEYDNPADRRFHAQPNACPVCGPHVELWDALGTHLSTQDVAIAERRASDRSGFDRRRQRHRRVSPHRGRALRGSCPPAARAQASRGKTTGRDVSVVGVREAPVRGLAAGGASAPLARGADCSPATEEGRSRGVGRAE